MPDSRRSSRCRWSPRLGRSAGTIWIAVACLLSTSMRPSRSTIAPRGASTLIVRSWLLRAARRYCVPESTCSAQSRKNRIPKTASVIAPRMPILSASCGVRRYGSSTRGSRGRKRPAGVLANDRHLHAARRGITRVREQPPDDRVDRHCQEQVEGQRGRHRVDQRRPGLDRLSEEEVESELADGEEERDHGDGYERGVGAVAPGRLAVASDPVAGERQQQRGDAEGPEVRGVKQEAGPEAGDRTEDRAPQERDHEQQHEHEVRGAAEHVEGADDRRLDDDGKEEQQRRLERVGEERHGNVGSGVLRFRTSTASSESKSTNGSTWICWLASMSVWPTLVTTPIWMLRG